MVRIITKKTLLAIVAAGILLQSSPAAAEEQMSENNAAVLDELSLGDLLSMKITTGSFLELDLKKSPLSMTIITDEMVKASGARHMSELLEVYVPGFIYNVNKWNGTIWAMRGVANDRNTKIIYLVNGHKMNTQARDGFQSETVLGLLGDIERVEVLRGPAGLVYGSGAIAGIINVVTKKGDGNGSSVRVGASSDNSKEIEANVSGKPAENQTIDVSVGLRACEGLPYGTTRLYGTAGWPFSPPVPQGGPSDGRFGSNDGNWRVSADYALGERFSFYTRLTHQAEDAGGWFIQDPWPNETGAPDSSAPVRVIDGVEVMPYDDFWKTTESYKSSRRRYWVDNFFAEASYDQPIDENMLKLKLSYDRNTSRIVEAVLPKWSPNLTYPNGQLFETFGEARYMVNGMYLLKSIPQLQAAVGVEYRLDAVGPDMNGRNERDGNAKHYIVRNINYHTGSLFGEGFYDVNELLGIDGGFRLDVHTRAVMFNPKLALIAQPNEHNTVKLIYQSASNNGSVDNYEYSRYHVDNNGNSTTEPAWTQPTFKPDTANAYELANMIQPVPGASILHELKPEKVHSVEAVWVGKITDNITVEPSVAWGYIKDLFGWSQPIFRSVNVGSYQYGNIDMDVKYSSKKFKFGANHTYQRPLRTDPSKESKTYMMYEAADSAGLLYVFDKLNSDGDSTYRGWFSQSKPIELNLVQTTITYDGKAFLSLPTNMSKMYMIYSPFEWLSLSTSLRMVWGLPGMAPVIKKDKDKGYYFGFYERPPISSPGDLKDYIMTSVSKKWNMGLNFSLPNGIDIGLFAYNIIGTDNHKMGGDKDNRSVELDRNTVNTFRISQSFALDQKDLYGTDLRTLGLTLTKNF